MNQSMHHLARPASKTFLFLCLGSMLLTPIITHVARCEDDNSGPPISAGTLKPRSVETSSFSCEALLSVEPNTVRVGDRFDVECSIHTGSQILTYNGFLSDRHKLPAQIILCSRDGKTRVDLLRVTVHALEKSTARNWIFLRSGQTVGRRLSVVCKPSAPGAEEPFRVIDLAPGDYYIQAIYNHWIVAHWPNNPSSDVPLVADGDEPQPPRSHSRSQVEEAFIVSKPARLTVLPTTGNNKGLPARPVESFQLELRPGMKKAKFGGQATVQAVMVNSSAQPAVVFNPFLSGLLWRFPAVSLSICNPAGDEIRDVLAKRNGSSRAPANGDWLEFPPGGLTTCEIVLPGGYVPATPFKEPNKLSRAWYLELRARPPLLSGLPLELAAADGKTIVASRIVESEWYQSFTRDVTTRSHRVELEGSP